MHTTRASSSNDFVQAAGFARRLLPALAAALFLAACPANPPEVTLGLTDATPGVDAPGPGPVVDAAPDGDGSVPIDAPVDGNVDPPIDAPPIDAPPIDAPAPPPIEEFGRPNAFNGAFDLPPDNVILQRVSLDISGGLAYFGFIADTGTSNVELQMALYSESGGVPSSLVAETGSFRVNAGDNQRPSLGDPSPPPFIEAGNYWIAVLPRNALRVRQSGSITDTLRSFGRTFAQGFPGTVPSSTTNNLGVFNLYIGIAPPPQ
ncbi:hypothetical protein [Haliangium ochraceum]|uniref:Lipoprotein n=1 Tax=Haliangium ochraceum (strain DSM 14365 / JCM 11303 / SMP-2) TaxID=502025 RepID=D0LKD6_HALO1|nr:hypothetical protein [Haliangium ochraceum]ACY13170.1 hypothetical protein Hoch_0532 [Haliangium ochraceum DSM 14365]